MILEELTTPTTAKLPIREFAEHLKLGTGFSDDGTEDAVLEVCLRSAMASIEARIGKVLIKRNLLWTLTRWFDQRAQGIPVAPVLSIVSLTIGGDVVSPSLYRLEKDMHKPKLVAVGMGLPDVPEGSDIVITFEAGYGSWTVVPPDLRQAVLMLAASFYENRSGELRVNGMPFGVLALLESHRNIRIGGA